MAKSNAQRISESIEREVQKTIQAAQAKAGAPSVAVTGSNAKDVLNMGFGPLSTKGLNDKISSGAVSRDTAQTLAKKSSPSTKPATEKPSASETIKKEENRYESHTDTNDAKTKRDRAKKEYESYLGSDEHKRRLEENDNLAKRQSVYNWFLPPDQQIVPKVIRDEKEIELREAMEAAEAEYNAAEDNKVVVSDLEAITGLSNEERRQLELYAVGRDVDYFESLNPNQNGIQVGRAEQNAADLIAKYGQQRVDEMANTLSRQNNAKMTQQVSEMGQKHGNKSPVAASAGSVAANAVGGVAGFFDYFKELGRRDSRYKTLDPNAMGNLGSVYAEAVRGQVQQNIEGEDPNLLRKAASIGYQGLMSLADTVARGYLGGGAVGGATLAATNTFSQTMANASRKGATPAQAATMAALTAAVEAVSEKIPLDDLIKQAEGGKKAIEEILKTALKQAGIEAATEEISLVGSLLLEAAATKDNTAYQRNAFTRILRGESGESARESAAWDLMSQVLDTALVSMVAGSAASAGSQIYATVKSNSASQPTAEPVAAEHPQKATENKATTAAQYDSASENAPVEPVKAAGAVESYSGDNSPSGTVGAAKSKYRHEVKQSGVYGNTYQNANTETMREVGRQAQEMTPNVGQYDAISEAESLDEARLRTATAQDRYVEHRQLMAKTGWTGADNDTAMTLLSTYQKEGRGDRFRELVKKQREMATQGGQMIQSFAKYSREDATVAVKDAVEALENMNIDDVPRTFWAGSEKTRAATVGAKDDYSSTAASTMANAQQGSAVFSKRKMDRKSFDEWKTSVTNSMLEIANDIESVQIDDIASMRDIVRQLAKFRRTTAWFGTTDNLTKNADRILNKLDFDTAKTIAKAQLAMIPDDFRKRSAGEIAKTMRIHNMLTAVTTTARNTVGNATMGIMDAFSDSTTARAMDIALSKLTGIRTVGNDMKYGKTYLDAARDAADMAALCVELNIPMESESMYSAGNTRTYSSQGGAIMRFLSAYEKYLKYSLEVTDKFFEGGAESAVRQSIRDLGSKTGLNQAQIEGLSERTSRRRTYKENRSLAAGAKKIKQGANTMIGVGEVGAGDILMPFAGVPMEIGQTSVDYSGSGAFLGVKEMIDVVNAARNGDKTITNPRTGEQVPIEIAQRKAVSDFGRGMTGVSLIALSTAAAAAGYITVHDSKDWEKKAMDESQNMTGAQFNLSALWRDIAGKPTDMQTNDVLIGMDFLEPFNSAMYIGYALSQEESVIDAIKSYPKHALSGVVSALMDLPVMSLMAEVQELIQSIGETDEEGNPAIQDAMGQVAGTVASSVVPSVVRQIAQTVDPNVRDTYDPNPIKKAGKQVVSSIPFASMTLPKKYNGFGEEQKRYDDSTIGGTALGVLNNLLLPDKVKQKKENAVADYIGKLSSATGETSMYPEEQAPYKFSLRGEEIELTGEQRSTYQKTYGEKNMELYSGLIDYPGFTELPEDVQIDAFRTAKTYATKYAKASVADYRESPTESMETLTKQIVMNSINGLFTGAFSDLVNSKTLGYDTATSVEDLDDAFSVYDGLPDAQRRTFREEASGRVKYFLEAKARGMETPTFVEYYQKYQDIGNNETLTTTQKANEWAAVLETGVDTGAITENQKKVMKRDMVFRYSLQAETAKFDEAIELGMSTKVAKSVVDMVAKTVGTGSVDKSTGKKTVRDVDKWETIANANLSEANKDLAIKLYMPDYDPNAKSVDRTEVKYEYARQVMGLSPEEFTAAKRLYDDNRYKADKIAAMEAVCDTPETARQLYYLLYGNQNRVPSVAWYEETFGVK